MPQELLVPYFTNAAAILVFWAKKKWAKLFQIHDNFLISRARKQNCKNVTVLLNF